MQSFAGRSRAGRSLARCSLTGRSLPGRTLAGRRLAGALAPFVGVLRAPSAPALVKVTGLAVIVAVLVNLAYYGQIAWAGEPLPPELAATQKCALLLIVIWLAQLAMALRGGDLSGGPSRPGAPSTPDRWSTIKSAKPRAEPPTRPGD